MGTFSKTISRMAAVSVALLSTGCLGATHYRAHTGYKGGYADARLDENTFKVSFTGNDFTSRTTAETYLMYRCAELSVAAGYSHFVVLQADGGWSPWKPGGPDGTSPPPTWVPPALEEHQRHHTPVYTALIRTSRTSAPGAHDARQLLAFLGPNIRR